ncbi:MAG: hypothetical protein NT113_10785 [Hyphomicrobiales bacterium]|nr:hypothetical protein [Hyphomicrobiales bacterium]
MTAKLRIKAKGIEIEWEGEVEYLKKDLPDLISAIVAALGVGIPDDEESLEQPAQRKTGRTFTTVSLAAKAKPATASALFKVALATLQISDKLPSATTAQILAEMRKATQYFKPAMPTNIHKNIQTLLSKSEINEPSAGCYVLTQTEADKLEALV